jgi:hypothetical protein
MRLEPEDMTKREQAFETLKALNPAAVFLQAYQSKRLPEMLDIYFGPPEEFFLSEERDLDPEPYTEGRRIPILDDGNFGVITFYDPQDDSLVQIDIECPGEIRAKFCNWQQYLAHLMLGIADSGVDRPTLRRMAGIIDFHCIDELFEYFQSYPKDESHDVFRRRKREFIERIKN